VSPHHAILYLDTTFDLTSQFGVTLLAQSEIELVNEAILSIATVRMIVQSAYKKPFEKKIKTIIITSNQIAIEAQHALLKILEEPPLSTKFIIVLPSVSGLLPTFCSRLFHLNRDDQAAQLLLQPNNFSSFLAQSYAKRLAGIATLVKATDSLALEQLRSAAILWLAANSAFLSRAKIAWCLAELPSRGSAKKMLWEEIALLLPVELS
jgi:DNA polymerase III delta prime subunit